jgi:hypothetical protein
MAITLEYSIDRGVNWVSLSNYTHPTSAGVAVERIDLGPAVAQTPFIRFRLTGTDAANWGLRRLSVKTRIRVDQDRDMT